MTDKSVRDLAVSPHFVLVSLSAVKVYARLATKAGVIPPTEHALALIGEVRGYGRTEGKRIDEARP